MFYNHAPDDYDCPFCFIAKGIENEHTKTKQADIIFKDRFITSFVASEYWPKTNGHFIIIPNQHFENLYDLPKLIVEKINDFAKRLALVIKKEFRSDGVSLRQHNEPAGDQSIWHFHLDVFPRYEGDNLYLNHSKRIVLPQERKEDLVYRTKKYFKSKFE